MNQQQAMERIMKQWVRTSHNLRCFEATFGKGFKTTEETRKQKNEQERILKANGFVYRIVTEPKEGEYAVNYIFRKKAAKNARKIHDNWLTKHYGHEWVSSNFNIIEMQEGATT